MKLDIPSGVMAAALLCCCLLSGCGASQTATGSQGPPGPVGPAGSPGLVFLNAYKAATPYVATDSVTFQGSSYVALAPSSGIRPVGDASSGAAWAVLAQAGADGAAGPQGIPGVSGATGAGGAPGPSGPPGPSGVPGTQGLQGPIGVQGLTGSTGVQGPTGPTGLQGPVGPAGANLVSFLKGRRFGVQGDSISAAYGNAWQNVVLARTGMTLVSQDARVSRRFDTAFECYGTVTAGSALGVFQRSNSPMNCFSTAGSDGNTLAQNLADVDLEVIELGTNDQYVPLGALGDSTAAGTFFGNMRWVVENYLTAKPSVRLVFVTPQRNGFAAPAITVQYVNAMVAYGNSMGVPVINMYILGGLNDFSSTILTIDGTHPSDYGFSNFYGPVIAQALQRIY